MLKRLLLLSSIALSTACGGDRTLDITLVRPTIDSEISPKIFDGMTYRATVFTPYYNQGTTGIAFYPCDTIGAYHKANSKELADPTNIGVVSSTTSMPSTGFRRYFNDADQYSNARTLDIPDDGDVPVMLYFEVWTSTQTDPKPTEPIPFLRGCGCVRRKNSKDPGKLTADADQVALENQCEKVLRDGEATPLEIELGSIIPEDTTIAWPTDVDIRNSTAVDVTLQFQGKHNEGTLDIWAFASVGANPAWVKAVPGEDGESKKFVIPRTTRCSSGPGAEPIDATLWIPGFGYFKHRFPCNLDFRIRDPFFPQAPRFLV